MIYLQFALAILVYIACIKFAARLFRRTQLSWTHAAMFGVGLFVALFAVNVLLSWLNLVSDLLSHTALYIGIGLVAQLALGGWFLGPRARTTEGATLGFTGGALLSLITYGLVFCLAIAAAVLFN